MEFDLVVEGRAVTPRGVQELQIGILGGRIAEMRRQGLKGGRRISAGSCIIFPGFIDPHVHLREPGWEQKEDFASGSEAAVHGGVTTVFDMPNNPVPATDIPTLETKAKLARSKAVIDVKFFGGVSGSLSQVREIRSKVIGYKIYLAETTGNLRLPTKKLRAALAAVNDAGKPASVHCEEQSIIDQKRKELSGLGRPDLHSDLRPPEAELDSVRKVLALRGDAKVNICHVSTGGALGLVEKSRGQRPRVTCEVTLHHLFFSRRSMYKSDLLRTNPPLRNEEDREAMLEGLRTGRVDFLVTDHAPHTLTEKRVGGACGVPGLDNYGNLVSWLIKRHGFDLETIAAVCSGNQARFFGLKDRGAIELGRRADLTLLDLKAPERVASERMRTKCGWTPYEGFEFPGRVRWTIFGGSALLEDYELAV